MHTHETRVTVWTSSLPQVEFGESETDAAVPLKSFYQTIFSDRTGNLRVFPAPAPNLHMKEDPMLDEVRFAASFTRQDSSWSL